MAGYNLKNPEEVKEYLKNLLTEYQFGCYSEKNPEVCHRLGDYAETIQRDEEKAGSLYKMTCDTYNYGRSCAKYGSYLTIGKGGKKNIREGYDYLSKSCDLNDAKGCYNAGLILLSCKELLINGEVVQVDEALKVLNKSCNLNHENACLVLSGIYAGSAKLKVDPNYEEVHRLSLKCCEMGNPYACINVSKMYKKGSGVEKDIELANKYKKLAEEMLMEYKKGIQLEFQQGADL